MRLILGLCLLPALSLASFCGENGVPFSLEVLPNGKRGLFFLLFSTKTRFKCVVVSVTEMDTKILPQFINFL